MKVVRGRLISLRSRRKNEDRQKRKHMKFQVSLEEIAPGPTQYCDQSLAKSASALNTSRFKLSYIAKTLFPALA